MNHHQTPSSLLYFVFIIFLVALCGAGYSAYSLLSNPASYAENAWQTRNQPEPTTDTTTVAVENPATTTEIVTPTPEPAVVTPTTTTPDATAMTLPDALRDMAKRGVQLKQGDKGADVGTVQKFMNQYYKTKNPIDNDYGPGLTTQIKKFQTAQKLPVIGRVGPKTIEAMIKFAK